MASILSVVRRAGSVGAIQSIYDVFMRDTVTLQTKRIGRYIDYKNQRDAFVAAETTEFGDAANTLAGITGVTAFGTLTDL